MLLLRSLSSLAIPACLATVASALPQVFSELVDPDPMWLPFGTQPAALLFKQSVAADFDGDGFDDVIVQREKALEMMFGPGYFAVYVEPFASEVNDLAVRPGAAAGAPASLITVGLDGLVERSWSDAQSDHWDEVVLETGGWAGAKLVAVDAGTGRYYGVRQVDGAATVLLSGQSEPVSTLQANVRDLQLVRVDSDSDPEIVLMTGSKILVYETILQTDGTVVAYQVRSTTTYPSHTFATVRHSGSREHALWFNRDGQGYEHLLSVALHAGDDLTHSVFGGTPAVVACARGDFDGNGDDDLLYSHQSAPTLVLLRNVHVPNGTDPWPDFAEQETLFDYGPASTVNNRAQPAWSDIDNDGDLDASFAIQDGSMFFIGWTGSLHAGGPSIVHGENTAGMLANDGTAVRFEVSESLPAEADRVEVFTWQWSSGVGETDPEYDVLAPIWPSPVDGSLTVDVPIPPSESAPPVFFFLMRWAGGPTHATPARLYGVQMGGGSYLASIPEDMRGPIWNIFGGIGMLGTVCELVHLPDLPADRPPRPRS